MEINDAIEVRNFGTGEALFEAGDTPGDAFIIASGMVDIVVDNYGEPLVIETLERGEFVGEMALIDDGPRTASAIATAETQCVVFTKREFDDAIERSDLLIVSLLRLLAKRLRKSSESSTQGEDYSHLTG